MRIPFRYALKRFALASSPKGERYLAAFKALQDEVERHLARGIPASTTLWLVWRDFWPIGDAWSAYVVENLEIPPKKAKSVELASRLFHVQTKLSKGPRSGILPWYEKNKKHFQTLADAVTWKPRQEGLSSVGSFTIHDTLGLDTKSLQRSHDILKLALSKLPSYLKPLAYGDLYLVGQIGRKNWAAWYQSQKDIIFLRPTMRGVSIQDSATHFIHELAHRFWHKKLPQSVKDAWNRYHRELSHQNDDKPSFPPEGTLFPPWAKVNNKTVRVGPRTPTGVILFDAKTGDTIGEMPIQQILQYMRKIHTMSAFPTLYAASDAEEHFCESVALKAMGTLPKDLAENFERVTGLR